MTSSDTVTVIDVNAKEYSINGNVVGKTSDDVIQAENLLIKPIDLRLKSLIKKTNEYSLHIHLAENLSYGVFYKIIATASFSGITSIQYVVGNKFKTPFEIYLPERNDRGCQKFKSVMRLFNLLNETYKSSDEFIKDKRQEIECAEKYMELSLFVTEQNMIQKYEVRLNELGIIGGGKSYTLKNEKELWNLLDDIRSRTDLENKLDRNKIVFVADKNILLKNIVPIITKLTEYGYEISYAALGS
ncbi:hypothetical protein [Fibrobacter sp.]|uniref:hypothetical protein n=1 Tax=Fibrobacter sp. TaxID=35828 RepID=UPI00386BD40F